MNSVNKTLYIPLYGKAYVSTRGLFLKDSKAEEIWAAEGFPLKGKSASKWLAFYMGIRSAVFDSWVRQKMKEFPNAVVIHVGCGLDSRNLRVGTSGHKWYDLDFPQVIAERKHYFEESDCYRMISGDAADTAWLEGIPEKDHAIVILEGVSMYLMPEALKGFQDHLCGHFACISLLMDCYSGFAAKMSRYRNPINDVGVTEVFGQDDPMELQQGKLMFVEEHSMTPQQYIDELKGTEKLIFSKLYAGSFAKRLYRLYEYSKG